MKTINYKLFLVVFLLSTSCEHKENAHNFNQKVISDVYLKSEATCDTPAIYYYSCKCGEKSLDTFENGEPLGHINGNKKQENIVNETFSENGSYEENIYCSRCDKLLTSTIVKIDKKSPYSLKYDVSNESNGYLLGETNQYINQDNPIAKEVCAIANIGYKFDGWSDGLTSNSRIDYKETDVKAIFIKEELDYPVLSINQINNEIEKGVYQSCNISLSNAKEEYEFDNLPANIKGRGNASWECDKKSYTIKFDKKINLFGNGKEKKWTLISNYYDTSLIRNYLAYNSSRLFESQSYTTSCEFVDLYLNDKYIGLYLLCETIESGESRIDIDTDISKNTKEECGYILEMDHRLPYESDKFVNYDYFYDCYVNKEMTPFALCEPESDETGFDSKYTEYIRDYVQNSLQQIKTGSWDSVCNYIDVNSFVESYIIYELFCEVDVCFSSFYMYKKNNGLLCCGPSWDFDRSLGNDTIYDSYKVDSLYAGVKNTWFSYLLKRNEFKELVKDKLNEKGETLMSYINNEIESFSNGNSSIDRNFLKWNNLIGYDVADRTPKELIEIKTYSGTVKYLKDWINNRYSFLISYFCN